MNDWLLRSTGSQVSAVLVTGVLVLGVPASAAGAVRSPGGPPLVSGSALPGQSEPSQDGAPEAANVSQGDPLVDNGLQSPLCLGGGPDGSLPASAVANCRTSGFIAAPDPTENYAFDVHTESQNLLGVDPEGLLQHYALEPAWMALVWIVHALIVALEWCYTLDLLNSSAMASVARALHQLQARFTQPWLAAVMAAAAIIAAHHGLVRRRVAQTLSEALLMALMMAAGLWVIADPAGTVGALARWSNEASLGALGAAYRGSPADSAGALAEGMQEIFATTVQAPWCYMEFGSVRWCQEPGRLDPQLRSAALAIAAAEQAQASCASDNGSSQECTQGLGEQAQSLLRSAQLLRAANTNGELFLALPADQPQRNSISQQGSLLQALCDGSELGHCRGPTAAEAEFRTGSGTSSRAEGLILIGAGVLGMVLLVGFIALRLLEACIVALLYLLAAPVLVLAPAFGEAGRNAFRTWGSRLLGAVASKLVYSLLLGIALLVTRILLALPSLGWWVQWLLVSTLWWGAYRNRHRLLGFSAGGSHAGSSARTPKIASRLAEGLFSPSRVARRASWVWKRISASPDPEHLRALGEAARQRAGARAREQTVRSLDHEHQAESARVARDPAFAARLAQARAQLERVRAAQRSAQSSGDLKRAAKLGVRAHRIEGELEHKQRTLRSAQAAERAVSRTGNSYTREQAQARAEFLDSQAALPTRRERLLGATVDRAKHAAADGASAAVSRPPSRDYQALAGLAGYGPQEYMALAPAGQRAARLAIDRELALRKELDPAAAELANRGADALKGRERKKVGRDLDRALEQRLREQGQSAPRRSEVLRKPPESPVMRDAQAVAERRKRQLGWERR